YTSTTRMAANTTAMPRKKAAAVIHTRISIRRSACSSISVAASRVRVRTNDNSVRANSLTGPGKGSAAADQDAEHEAGGGGDADRLPGVLAHVLVGGLGGLLGLVHDHALGGNLFTRLRGGGAQQFLGVGDHLFQVGDQLLFGCIVDGGLGTHFGTFRWHL